MILRLFSVGRIAALLLFGLGFGAAPAAAGGCGYNGCYAPAPVVYQSCGCCGCGSSYYTSYYAAYAYPAYAYPSRLLRLAMAPRDLAMAWDMATARDMAMAQATAEWLLPLSIGPASRIPATSVRGATSAHACCGLVIEPRTFFAFGYR